MVINNQRILSPPQHSYYDFNTPLQPALPRYGDERSHLTDNSNSNYQQENTDAYLLHHDHSLSQRGARDDMRGIAPPRSPYDHANHNGGDKDRIQRIASKSLQTGFDSAHHKGFVSTLMLKYLKTKAVKRLVKEDVHSALQEAEEQQNLEAKLAAKEKKHSQKLRKQQRRLERKQRLAQAKYSHRVQQGRETGCLVSMNAFNC